jgi:hypothetical protein
MQPSKMGICRHFADMPDGNHNPRVGGSSPSSGIKKGQHTRIFSKR